MKHKNTFLFFVFIILIMARVAQAQLVPNFEPDKTWIQRELTQMKLPKSFIKEALNNYHQDSFDTVVKLNLLGFLKPPQHMDLVTKQAVTESSRFLKENKKTFDQAHKKYQVSAEVISALLWVETRHGDNTGTFHTVSVFLHLLQADRAKNRQFLTAEALEQNKTIKAYSAKELKKKMKERTLKKSQWAREQLQALATIHKKGQLNLKTLKGSYAGAFGLAQFIPSSYRDYAKTAGAHPNPNLMKPKDAIFSVANYLARHGWKKGKADRKVMALMKYNNSRDYADSILEISRKVTSKGGS